MGPAPLVLEHAQCAEHWHPHRWGWLLAVQNGDSGSRCRKRGLADATRSPRQQAEATGGQSKLDARDHLHRQAVYPTNQSSGPNQKYSLTHSPSFPCWVVYHELLLFCFV